MRRVYAVTDRGRPLPRTALFLSPHLDDVAFSCGGTVASLARAGWNVVVATVFTRSTPNATGFALSCQVDKGLPADADYMRLRRAEDAEFARTVGTTFTWLNLLEAPSRGYRCAAALFGGVNVDDDIDVSVTDAFLRLASLVLPTLVFAPQGLGNHVDHLQVIRAVRAVSHLAERALWYRDTPYAIHQLAAKPSDLLPAALHEVGRPIDDVLSIKIAACGAYKSQIPFQFGCDKNMAIELAAFSKAEGHRLGSGKASEMFLTHLGTELCEATGNFRRPI